MIARTLLLFAVILTGCDSYGVDLPPEPEAGVEAWDEMLTAINAVRAEGAVCGSTAMPPAPPLVWDSRLEKAAARHSRDMAQNDHFDHRGTDGASPGDRVRRAGYDWRVVAENIARYQQTVDEVVADWVASPGHCENLLNASYLEVGAAEDGTYWTQVFGVAR